MKTSDVKKLLLSRDLEQIRFGVAAAVELADDKIWGQLLDGVTWEPSRTMADGRRGEVKRPGRLQPNSVFKWNKVSQPWNELAMALLLAASPLPGREEVTSLQLAATDWRAADAHLSLRGFGGFTNLAWLSAQRAADLDGLAECGALTRLDLTQSAGELPSLPHLEELDIRTGSVTAAEGGSWPELRSITIVGSALDEQLLAGSPGLTALRATTALSVPTIVSGPRIETISITLREAMDGVTFADLPACTELTFESRSRPSTPVVVDGLGSLTSLQLANTTAEVRGCPAVERLSLGACELATDGPMASVTSLGMTRSAMPGPPIDFFPMVAALTTKTFPTTDVPLGAAVGDGVFTLEKGAMIGPLDAVASLADLEVLDLSAALDAGPEQPVSLEPLANAAGLRAVSFRGLTGVTDLGPLDGLPELRFVDAHGTGVAKGDVPPGLQKVVSLTKKEHSLAEARDRPHPSTPKTSKAPKPSPTASLPTDTRETVTKLKKLLLARDLAAIIQGVELTVALDDEAVWHGLLAGVGFDPDAELKERKTRRRPATTTRTVGRLVPNRLFAGGSHKAQLWHAAALAMLVAHSPMPVRDEVTGLTLGDWRASGEPIELSFRGFDRFPNLRWLELRRTVALRDLEPLGHCPALTELELSAPGPITLPGMVNLESLRVSGSDVISFEPSGSWPALRAVAAPEVADWAAFFQRAPELRRLNTYKGHPSGPEELASASVEDWEAQFTDAGVFVVAGAPALRTLAVNLSADTVLRVEDCPRLERLLVNGRAGRAPVAVARCPNLDSIVMEHATPGDLADLPRLTKLESVGARHQLQPESIRSLSGVEEVQLAGMQIQGELAVPPGARPRGNHLDLRGCRRLHDLGNIGELRNLKGVFLDSARLTSIEPLAACQELTVVDLRGTGVADLSPLAGLANLAVVYAANAKVTDVPDGVANIVSFVSEPDVAALIATLADGEALPAPRPANHARSPVDGVSTADWHSLVARLSTGDLDVAGSAADRAAELGEPTMAYLLDRVSVHKDGRRIGTRLPIRLADTVLRWVFVARLLRHAPGDSMQAFHLRSMIDLRVHAKTLSEGTAVLDDLGAFDQLRRADFRCHTIASADLTDSGVETLMLQVKVLDGLRIGPALRRLQVTDSAAYGEWAFDPIALHGSEVHTLVCDRVDGAALVGCNSLRRLYATRIDNIEALHDVPLVEVTDGGQPLEVWAGHPTLEVLNHRTNEKPESPDGISAAVHRWPVYRRPDVFQLSAEPAEGGGR